MPKPISDGERTLLKRLDAGLFLVEPNPGSKMYTVDSVPGKPVFRVRRTVVDSCIVEGWIERSGTGRWRVTAAGRAQIEVGAFVRAFSDAAP